ncbi:MAG: TAXI family TRAP transporter solute-binding subunit [Paracoccaceae bacterium]
MKIWKVAAIAAGLAIPAQAEEIKMATIAPGTSAYLTMTTMATIVNQAGEHNISVDATGAATKHQVQLAQGQLDLAMTSPTIFWLMQNGKAMYQKLEEAPELSENLRLITWFPFGGYHAVTYADSGIESLADLSGKKVFLGPPGGGAFNTAKQWVQAQTGMVNGEDYDVFKGSWSSAFQAFQDRQFDVYFIGGVAPFPQIEQLAATSEIRLLGPTQAQWEAQSEDQQKPTAIRGRSLEIITPGTYGEGVVNSEAVYTVGAVVGVNTRVDMDADVIYQITKAYWEGVEEMRATTPWLADITLEYAIRDGGMRLHPGAQRYYEEIGLTIPEGSMAN